MNKTAMLKLEDLTAAVHEALRAWHSGISETTLTTLVLVRKQCETAELNGGVLPTIPTAVKEVLLQAIGVLHEQNETAGKVLQLRFVDNLKIQEVAPQLGVNEYAVSRLQRTAIDQLAEVLLAQEEAERAQQAQMLEAQLPPASYTQTFGTAQACDEIITQLLMPENPWVTAIVGIGGLGKTTLADVITRQIIHTFRFDDIVWIRVDSPQMMDGRPRSPELTFEQLVTGLARRLWPDMREGIPTEQLLVQVRQSLKSKAYLVIVDNLEEESDASFLMNHFNDWAKPSKFLLTTRTRPAGGTAVYSYTLNELGLESAVELLRHHASETGVTTLADAAPETFQTIYEVTGGNPLALKLVVSLLDFLPMSQVLTDLRTSRRGPIEKLYRHIYWQTWQLLSGEARALLQAMPIVAEETGADPEYLQIMSGLTDVQLWPAIHELRNRSLLEVRGNLEEKRYGIHRLTETFLRTEIIHVPEDEEE